MNEVPTYRNLRFDQPRWTPSRRMVAVVLIVIVFTLLWKFIHHTALYWMLAPLVTVMAWISTYGWRQALVDLIKFLSQLEHS
jgi:hypothetical protein